MRFWVVIPARYASTRLPAKPLAQIAGKPMIQLVYENAMKSGAEAVVVATDDARIVTAVENFGGRVCLTAATHPSGTDRIAEAARLLNIPENGVVVNVQGDEPLLNPMLIQQVVENLAKFPQAQVATLCEPLLENSALSNPNIVKVIRDQQGFALYFSRAPIAWVRDEFTVQSINCDLQKWQLHYRHLGLYGYRMDYLQHYVQLAPCALEQAEALEQLRVLFYGGKIHVDVAQVAAGMGVDTLEDLEKVRAILEKP